MSMLVLLVLATILLALSGRSALRRRRGQPPAGKAARARRSTTRAPIGLRLQAARAERDLTKVSSMTGRRLAYMPGVTLRELAVVTRDGTFPLTGTSARVEAAGSVAVTRRHTVTRTAAGTAALGGIGLVGSVFFPKAVKHDNRELYLYLGGPWGESVVACRGKDGARVRRFAAKVNTAAAAAPARMAAQPALVEQARLTVAQARTAVEQARQGPALAALAPGPAEPPAASPSPSTDLPGDPSSEPPSGSGSEFDLWRPPQTPPGSASGNPRNGGPDGGTAMNGTQKDDTFAGSGGGGRLSPAGVKRGRRILLILTGLVVLGSGLAGVVSSLTHAAQPHPSPPTTSLSAWAARCCTTGEQQLSAAMSSLGAAVNTVATADTPANARAMDKSLFYVTAATDSLSNDLAGPNAQAPQVQALAAALSAMGSDASLAGVTCAQVVSVACIHAVEQVSTDLAPVTQAETAL